MRFTLLGTSIFATLVPTVGFAAPPADAVVQRDDKGHLVVTWSSPDPVDVKVLEQSDANPATAQPIVSANMDGKAAIEDTGPGRRYVILRNARTGESVHVAERLVPLTTGSNFRDIGGYAAANGKRVIWGRIFRSGASPMLSKDDLERVKALGLTQMIDLRSDEERQLAPTKIDGVPYSAVGYSMAALFAGTNGGAVKNGIALYHGLPKMLAPQMRLIFSSLSTAEGPVAYNCSAGQDRTGVATAIILSALGVSREDIYRDYLLSVKYRQPVNEMPRIDPALYPGNMAAQLFGRFQNSPDYLKPQPLQEEDGTPFLKGAFDEIEARWGSVDGYLRAELGVEPSQIARLRRLYTEK